MPVARQERECVLFIKMTVNLSEKGFYHLHMTNLKET